MGLLFVLCPHAHAQEGKIYRIGRLSGGSSSSTFGIEALRRELRELGYVEGKNIVFERRYAEEKPERLPGLADELVRLKVDVIVAGGPNDGLAAKKATKTIPIVFTDTPFDPVARGLVASVARPGGNTTGFYSLADVLAGKRVEALKESIAKLCASLSYGTQALEVASLSGPKASELRGNLGCKFIQWRLAAAKTTRAASKRRSKREARLFQ